MVPQPVSWSGGAGLGRPPCVIALWPRGGPRRATGASGRGGAAGGGRRPPSRAQARGTRAPRTPPARRAPAVSSPRGGRREQRASRRPTRAAPWLPHRHPARGTAPCMIPSEQNWRQSPKICNKAVFCLSPRRGSAPPLRGIVAPRSAPAQAWRRMIASQSVKCWYAYATLIKSGSSKKRPTSCILTGRPADDLPTGRASAGWPV